MIRAYDDNGNVVDMVEHDKQIREEVINRIDNLRQVKLTREYYNIIQRVLDPINYKLKNITIYFQNQM